jgi:hypothetical protein
MIQEFTIVNILSKVKRTGIKTNQFIQIITHYRKSLPNKQSSFKRDNLTAISIGYENKVCLDKEINFV